MARAEKATLRKENLEEAREPGDVLGRGIPSRRKSECRNPRQQERGPLPLRSDDLD